MPKEHSDVTYTIVTCHFGDLFWVTNLMNRLDRYRDRRIVGSVIIDQSRVSRDDLACLPGVITVVSFPEDIPQIELAGHDHPASLDRFFSSYSFESTHIVLFDSDAFPLVPDWLDYLQNVTLAEVPGSEGELSHPAFMVFPVSALPFVRFSDRFLERTDASTRFRFDTGRMVASQLVEAGLEVTMTPASPAFSGFRGVLYLQGKIYHHGHGSFPVGSRHFQAFVSPATEAVWRRIISRGQMHLRLRDYIVLTFLYFARRIANLRKKARSSS